MNDYKNKIINQVYYLIGIAFLILAKLKFIIKGGYSTPKPFSIAELQQCSDYDINIVKGWMEQLKNYTGDQDNGLRILNQKVVLELGPGSDLGIGLYLLAKGAKEYNAVDVNDLIAATPDSFYTFFINYLREKEKLEISGLEEEVQNVRAGKGKRLNFIVRKDFNLVTALATRKVDFVVSNAAFEHFRSIDDTIEQISSVTNPGAFFVAFVDLKTHSRWIRDKDPNNIYRYPQWLYNFLNFPASPNRVRPYEYKKALELNGWENIKIEGANLLDNSKSGLTKNYLHPDFLDEKNQMHYLSTWIIARKT